MAAVSKINLLVVDISHHNNVRSFQRLYDSGVRGVIHKASQSTGMVDKFYAWRRTEAINCGLLWGAYHFADNQDPEAQVDHFLDAARPDDDTLMALDYEPNGAITMGLKQAKAFLTMLDERLGRRNVLYSGNLIKETLKSDPGGWWRSHPLWLPQYGKIIKLPQQWTEAFLWQFSDGKVNVQGTVVDGIDGEVDRNSFDGTETYLRTKWVQKKD